MAILCSRPVDEAVIVRRWEAHDVRFAHGSRCIASANSLILIEHGKQCRRCWHSCFSPRFDVDIEQCRIAHGIRSFGGIAIKSDAASSIKGENVHISSAPRQGNVDAGDIVLETSGSHGDSGGRMRFTSVSSSLEAQETASLCNPQVAPASGSGGIRLETSAGTGSVPADIMLRVNDAESLDGSGAAGSVTIQSGNGSGNVGVEYPCKQEAQAWEEAMSLGAGSASSDTGAGRAGSVMIEAGNSVSSTGGSMSVSAGSRDRWREDAWHCRAAHPPREQAAMSSSSNRGARAYHAAHRI